MRFLPWRVYSPVEERDEKQYTARKVHNSFIGTQKTFSVPDLACDFSIISCLFFNVNYQDPSDGIHIHRTPPCDLISKCLENQAAPVAQYLGLSHLIRKGIEPSAQSKRKFVLWWWGITPYLPLSWSLSLFSSSAPLKALAICDFTPPLFRVFLFLLLCPGTYPGQCRGFCLILPLAIAILIMFPGCSVRAQG